VDGKTSLWNAAEKPVENSQLHILRCTTPALAGNTELRFRNQAAFHVFD